MKQYIHILVLLFLTSCAGMKSSNPIKTTDIYDGQYHRLMNYAADEDLAKMAAVQYQSSLDLNYADPAEGVSLLNWCIFNNKPKAFEKLLELGADPNWQDTAGKFAPPVTEAAQIVSTDQFLVAALQHKADPNRRSVKVLGSENQTPLLGAVASGELKHVQLLVEKGADVNYCADTNNSWLPLTDAIVLKHLDIAKYLLEHGADPHKVRFKRSETEILDMRQLLEETEVNGDAAMQKQKEELLAMLQQAK